MPYMPFLSFLISFIGLILIFMGGVRWFAIWREFSMYFDKRDQIPEDTKQQRQRKIYISVLMIVIGIILFVVSFFV